MNILERHRRLRVIGEAILRHKRLSDDDRAFIGQALMNIGRGSDARDELHTKPRQGEDNFDTARQRDVRDKLMYSWLEAAMAPLEEGGLGLARKEAIKRLKQTQAGQISFPISEETINSYLSRYPEKRKLSFTID